MTFKKLLNQLTTAAIVAGTTYAIASPVLAQQFAQQFPFYFPSASFFSPMAAGFESEDLPDLETVLEANVADGKYTTLYSALEETELMETLVEEEYLTVLAPTDEAFASLSPEIKEKLADPDNLKKVLQYHLVNREIGKEEIERQAVATLLEENEVKITGVPEGDKVGVKFNEAKASDPLFAQDGAIVPVDRVLIPPTL